MTLYQHEVPVAFSMVRLAHPESRKKPLPFESYMCYWTAFNNIYTTLADRKGNAVEFRKSNGSMRRDANGSVNIPKMKPTRGDKKEIEQVFDAFDENLKESLITHPNTDFFVHRIPRWKYHEIEFDANQQRVNGVINIRYTISEQHPVWSPIDIHAYERYKGNKLGKGDTDLLANQILLMLYTIRNNLFHGGKRADDANARQVVEMALPLLKMIVEFFIPDITNAPTLLE